MAYISKEMFYTSYMDNIVPSLDNLILDKSFFCYSSYSSVLADYRKFDVRETNNKNNHSSYNEAINFFKTLANSINSSSQDMLNSNKSKTTKEEETIGDVNALDCIKLNNQVAFNQLQTIKTLKNNTKDFLKFVLSRYISVVGSFPNLKSVSLGNHFNRASNQNYLDENGVLNYHPNIKYALGQIVSESFPGLKPSTQWPISLEDLNNRIDKLNWDELFYQPFDENNNFLLESFAFIAKTAKNIKNIIINEFNLNDKINLEALLGINSDLSFEKDNLLKSLTVVFKLTYLSGNFSKIMDLCDFLNRELVNTILDKALESNNITNENILEFISEKILKEALNSSQDCLVFLEDLLKKYSFNSESKNNNGCFTPYLEHSSIMKVFSINKNMLFSTENYPLDSCTSVTSDGSYIYAVFSGLHGMMLKIGSGFNNTIQGYVYTFKPYLKLSEALQIVYYKEKLYLREVSDPLSLSIYCPLTLRKLNKIKLMIPEMCTASSKCSFTTKKNLKSYNLVSNENGLGIVLFEPVLNKTKQVEKTDNTVLSSELNKNNESNKNIDDKEIVDKAVNDDIKEENTNEPLLLEKKDNIKEEIKISQFSHINLVYLEYDPDAKDSTSLLDKPENKADKEIVEEMYDTFSGLYNKEECYKALKMNNFDFEESALFLIDNSEKVKESLLIPNKSVVIMKIPIVTNIPSKDNPKTTTKSFGFGTSITNNVSDISFRKEVLLLLNLNNFDRIKWLIVDHKLQGYCFSLGMVNTFSINKDNNSLIKYNIKDLTTTCFKEQLRSGEGLFIETTLLNRDHCFNNKIEVCFTYCKKQELFYVLNSGINSASIFVFKGKDENYGILNNHRTISIKEILSIDYSKLKESSSLLEKVSEYSINLFLRFQNFLRYLPWKYSNWNFYYNKELDAILKLSDVNSYSPNIKCISNRLFSTIDLMFEHINPQLKISTLSKYSKELNNSIDKKNNSINIQDLSYHAVSDVQKTNKLSTNPNKTATSSLSKNIEFNNDFFSYAYIDNLTLNLNIEDLKEIINQEKKENNENSLINESSIENNDKSSDIIKNPSLMNSLAQSELKRVYFMGVNNNTYMSSKKNLSAISCILNILKQNFISVENKLQIIYYYLRSIEVVHIDNKDFTRNLTEVYDFTLNVSNPSHHCKLLVDLIFMTNWSNFIPIKNKTEFMENLFNTYKTKDNKESEDSGNYFIYDTTPLLEKNLNLFFEFYSDKGTCDKNYYCNILTFISKLENIELETLSSYYRSNRIVNFSLTFSNNIEKKTDKYSSLAEEDPFMKDITNQRLYTEVNEYDNINNSINNKKKESNKQINNEDKSKTENSIKAIAMKSSLDTNKTNINNQSLKYFLFNTNLKKTEDSTELSYKHGLIRLWEEEEIKYSDRLKDLLFNQVISYGIKTTDESSDVNWNAFSLNLQKLSIYFNCLLSSLPTLLTESLTTNTNKSNETHDNRENKNIIRLNNIIELVSDTIQILSKSYDYLIHIKSILYKNIENKSIEEAKIRHIITLIYNLDKTVYLTSKLILETPQNLVITFIKLNTIESLLEKYLLIKDKIQENLNLSISLLTSFTSNQKKLPLSKEIPEGDSNNDKIVNYLRKKILNTRHLSLVNLDFLNKKTLNYNISNTESTSFKDKLSYDPEKYSAVLLEVTFSNSKILPQNISIIGGCHSWGDIEGASNLNKEIYNEESKLNNVNLIATSFVYSKNCSYVANQVYRVIIPYHELNITSINDDDKRNNMMNTNYKSTRARANSTSKVEISVTINVIPIYKFDDIYSEKESSVIINYLLNSENKDNIDIQNNAMILKNNINLATGYKGLLEELSFFQNELNEIKIQSFIPVDNEYATFLNSICGVKSSFNNSTIKEEVDPIFKKYDNYIIDLIKIGSNENSKNYAHKLNCSKEIFLISNFVLNYSNLNKKLSNNKDLKTKNESFVINDYNVFPEEYIYILYLINEKINNIRKSITSSDSTETKENDQANTDNKETKPIHILDINDKDISKYLSLEDVSNLHIKMRTKVKEPMILTRIKMMNSFIPELKEYWKYIEYLFMLVVYYHCDLDNVILFSNNKIKNNNEKNEDTIPLKDRINSLSNDAIEIIGNTCNELLTWMVDRVHYIKETFDTVLDFSSTIESTTLSFIKNIKNVYLLSLLFNINLNLANEEKELISKFKELEKSKKKAKKEEKQVKDTKPTTTKKPINFKKKENVKRLYTDLSKKKTIKDTVDKNENKDKEYSSLEEISLYILNKKIILEKKLLNIFYAKNKVNDSSKDNKNEVDYESDEMISFNEIYSRFPSIHKYIVRMNEFYTQLSLISTKNLNKENSENKEISDTSKNIDFLDSYSLSFKNFFINFANSNTHVFNYFIELFDYFKQDKDSNVAQKAYSSFNINDQDIKYPEIDLNLNNQTSIDNEEDIKKLSTNAIKEFGNCYLNIYSLIKVLKSSFSAKIEKELSINYYGNPERLKNICEIHDLKFDLNNLKDSLSAYSKFIILHKLSTVIQLSETLHINEEIKESKIHENNLKELLDPSALTQNNDILNLKIKIIDEENSNMAESTENQHTKNKADDSNEISDFIVLSNEVSPEAEQILDKYTSIIVKNINNIEKTTVKESLNYKKISKSILQLHNNSPFKVLADFIFTKLLFLMELNSITSLNKYQIKAEELFLNCQLKNSISNSKENKEEFNKLDICKEKPLLMKKAFTEVPGLEGERNKYCQTKNNDENVSEIEEDEYLLKQIKNFNKPKVKTIFNFLFQNIKYSVIRQIIDTQFLRMKLRQYGLIDYFNYQKFNEDQNKAMLDSNNSNENTAISNTTITKIGILTSYLKEGVFSDLETCEELFFKSKVNEKGLIINLEKEIERSIVILIINSNRNNSDSSKNTSKCLSNDEDFLIYSDILVLLNSLLKYYNNTKETPKICIDKYNAKEFVRYCVKFLTNINSKTDSNENTHSNNIELIMKTVKEILLTLSRFTIVVKGEVDFIFGYLIFDAILNKLLTNNNSDDKFEILEILNFMSINRIDLRYFKKEMLIKGLKSILILINKCNNPIELSKLTKTFNILISEMSSEDIEIEFKEEFSNILIKMGDHFNIKKNINHINNNVKSKGSLEENSIKSEDCNSKKQEYKLLIQMNAPEVDYLFILNAIYYWIEKKDKDKNYTNDQLLTKLKKLKPSVPACISRINYFNPLKTKVKKTFQLDTIVKNQLDSLVTNKDKLKKQLELNLKRINDYILAEKKKQELLEKQLKEKEKEQQKDIENNKENNNPEISLNAAEPELVNQDPNNSLNELPGFYIDEKDLENKEKGSKKDREDKNGEKKGEEKKVFVLKDVEEENIVIKNTLEFYDINIEYTKRIQSYVALTESIGHTATVRGFCGLEADLDQREAEELTKVIYAAYYNFLPYIPKYYDTQKFTNTKLFALENKEIIMDEDLFIKTDIFPPPPKQKEYIAGYFGVLSETTIPFLNVVVMRSEEYNVVMNNIQTKESLKLNTTKADIKDKKNNLDSLYYSGLYGGSSAFILDIFSVFMNNVFYKSKHLQIFFINNLLEDKSDKQNNLLTGFLLSFSGFYNVIKPFSRVVKEDEIEEDKQSDKINSNKSTKPSSLYTVLFGGINSGMDYFYATKINSVKSISKIKTDTIVEDKNISLNPFNSNSKNNLINNYFFKDNIEDSDKLITIEKLNLNEVELNNFLSNRSNKTMFDNQFIEFIYQTFNDMIESLNNAIDNLTVTLKNNTINSNIEENEDYNIIINKLQQVSLFLKLFYFFNSDSPKDKNYFRDFINNTIKEYTSKKSGGNNKNLKAILLFIKNFKSLSSFESKLNDILKTYTTKNQLYDNFSNTKSIEEFLYTSWCRINDYIECSFTNIIYSKIFSPIDEIHNFVANINDKIDASESKIEENKNCNLINDYNLPESDYALGLPKLYDLSKSLLAFRNMISFERYVVQEVHNYAKGSYDDKYYKFALNQMRFRLSINDIAEIKNDISLVFDKTRIPFHMPLPKEHRDMRELFKEECFPFNYYSCKLKLSQLKRILTNNNSLNNTKNNSLSEFLNNYISVYSNSNLCSSSLIQSNASTSFTSEADLFQSNQNESSIQNKLNNTPIEITVLLLIADYYTKECLCLYDDEISSQKFTFWCSLDSLAKLNFNIKPPSSSYSYGYLINEYLSGLIKSNNFFIDKIQNSLFNEMHSISNLTQLPIDSSIEILLKEVNYEDKTNSNYNFLNFVLENQQNNKNIVNGVVNNLSKHINTPNFKAFLNSYGFKYKDTFSVSLKKSSVTELSINNKLDCNDILNNIDNSLISSSENYNNEKNIKYFDNKEMLSCQLSRNDTNNNNNFDNLIVDICSKIIDNRSIIPCTSIQNLFQKYLSTKITSSINSISDKKNMYKDSVNLIKTYLLDTIPKISNQFSNIKINLYSEYTKGITKESNLVIGNMFKKLLPIHELNTSNTDYQGIIITFTKEAFLAPNAKISFYSDPYGEKTIKKLYSIKAAKTNLEKIVIDQKSCWMYYYPGNSAFALGDWVDLNSNLSCNISFIPTICSPVISLIEDLTSEYFTDLASYDFLIDNLPSSDSNLNESSKLIFNELISITDNLAIDIRKHKETYLSLNEILISECVKNNYPIETQKILFNITNRVLLKTIKYIKLLKKAQNKSSIKKSIDKNEYDCDKEEGLSTTSQIKELGLSCSKITDFISKLDEVYTKTSTDSNNNKTFTSSYIVEGVEILLTILSSLDTSFFTLQNYFQEVESYSLPIWIEGIVKLGHFLNYLQKDKESGVYLESELLKEIKQGLKIRTTPDSMGLGCSTFLNKNLYLVENINGDLSDDEIRERIISIIEEKGSRLVDKEYDIMIFSDPDKHVKSNVEFEIKTEIKNKKTEEEEVIKEEIIIENKENKEIAEVKKLEEGENSNKLEKSVSNSQISQLVVNENKIMEKIVKEEEKKPPIVNIDKKIKEISTPFKVKSALILIDSFKIKELKEKVQETNIIEEDAFTMWRCKMCHMDNDGENTFCVFCNEDKAVEELEKPAIQGKSNISNSENFDFTLDELATELKEILSTHEKLKKAPIKKIVYLEDNEDKREDNKEQICDKQEQSENKDKKEEKVDRMNKVVTVTPPKLISHYGEDFIPFLIIMGIIELPTIETREVLSERLNEFFKHRLLGLVLLSEENEKFKSNLTIHSILNSTFSKRIEEIVLDNPELSGLKQITINSINSEYLKITETKELKEDNNETPSIISFIKEKVNNLSIDYLRAFIDLENEGIDMWLQDTNNYTTKNFSLDIIEKIRELLDNHICNISSLVFVYPSTHLRFNNRDKCVNHTHSQIINSINLSDIQKQTLAQNRYYLSLVKYFNACLHKAMPLLKPFTSNNNKINSSFQSTCIYTNDDKNKVPLKNISFIKSMSEFLSSYKGLTVKMIKDTLTQQVLEYTAYSKDEIQKPTFKFERMNILSSMTNKNQTENNENTAVINNITNTNKVKRLSINQSLFLQSYEQAKEIDPAFFRSQPEYNIHVGFQVEFKGEFAQGIGGPYRQFFTDISLELQPKYLKSSGALDLLIPTSNNQAQKSDFRHKYTLNCSNNKYELYEHLGFLLGICLRTGTNINIDLCSLVWKKLTGEKILVSDVIEFDEGMIEMIRFINSFDCKETFEDEFNLDFNCQLTDGTYVNLRNQDINRKNSLLSDNKSLKEDRVKYFERYEYLRLMLKARLSESDVQVKHLKIGLCKIIPESILQLFTYKELENLICGEKTVSIDLLIENTKYIMGLDESSDRIKWLWEILRECSEEERIKFIKFCWAQERLPASKEDYERNHIKFTIKPSINTTKIDSFPKADTCFFILELPNFSSKEKMKKILLTAITLDNISINADKEDEINANINNNYDEASYEYEDEEE